MPRPVYTNGDAARTDTDAYPRMKDVARYDYEYVDRRGRRSTQHAFVARVRWGGETVRGFFGDHTFGGPESALVAANAFAADCYLALGKPLTSRRTPFNRPRSDNPYMGVTERGGGYVVTFYPEVGKRSAIYLPRGTPLEDAIALRDHLQQEIWARYPIHFYR